MLTRRHFLATSTAAFAANLFGAPKDSKTPPPELEKLGDVALREGKKDKATYCDIRIVRLRDQRDRPAASSPERGTGKTIVRAQRVRGFDASDSASASSSTARGDSPRRRSSRRKRSRASPAKR